MFEHNYTIQNNRSTDDTEPTNTTQLLICFVDDTVGSNYQTFLTSCRFNNSKEISNSTKWVLVSVADVNRNDNLEVLKFINNDTLSNVQALIMLSSRYPRPLDETQADEQSKFLKPPIITIQNYKEALTFKKYAWNCQDEATQNATSFILKHTYINRCYLLDPFKPALDTLAGIFLLITLVWLVFVFVFWKF